MSDKTTTEAPWWEIRLSVVHPGEWCYRRTPGRGFWLWARFARRAAA